MPGMEPIKGREGTKVINTLGYEMECIEYFNAQNSTIRFTKTGTTIYEVQWSQFIRGKVKDKASPSVYGWGIIGNVEEPAKHPLYFVWMMMIKRCYHKKDKDYKFAGAKGITINKRWQVFHKFLKDAMNMSGYEIVKNPDIKATIFLHEGETEYGPDTCSFIASDMSRSLRKNTVKVKLNGKSFVTQMMIDKKMHYIGSFKTKKQAEDAYDKYLETQIIKPAIKQGLLPKGFQLRNS